jgi:hypothetical protein
MREILIEKKMIVLCICALVIGIAITIPLAHFAPLYTNIDSNVQLDDAIVTFSDGTIVTCKNVGFDGDVVALHVDYGDELELELQQQKAKEGPVTVTFSDGMVVKGKAIPYVGGIVVTDVVILKDVS